MKHVFLTGATGVVGSEVARRFLAHPDWCLHLMVRAASRDELRAKIDSLWEYWGHARPDSALRDRVIPHWGDASAHRFSLERKEYEDLAREVTHIVHAAGNVKLNQSLEAACKDAVGTLRHVLALAELAQRNCNLAKVDLVSTVGVAGRMPGTIPEKLLTEPRRFRNTYEEAKATAEQVARGHLENGMPITLHRPSMVVGDSRTGHIRDFQVFYHLAPFLSGERTRGWMIRTGGAALDLVPVDYVAEAIFLSATHSKTAGRVFHLCAGPSEEWNITELSQWLWERARSQGKDLRPLRRLPAPLFRGLLLGAQHYGSRGMRAAAHRLPYFLDYLREPQHFQTSHTHAFFAEHGLRFPDRQETLRQALDYHARATSSKPAIKA